METAASHAICQFSVGSSNRSTLCRVLGIEPGYYLEQSSNEKDVKVLKKSIKASTENSKRK